MAVGDKEWIRTQKIVIRSEGTRIDIKTEADKARCLRDKGKVQLKKIRTGE